jgi:hypothetical protein
MYHLSLKRQNVLRITFLESLTKRKSFSDKGDVFSPLLNLNMIWLMTTDILDISVTISIRNFNLINLILKSLQKLKYYLACFWPFVFSPGRW